MVLDMQPVAHVLAAAIDRQALAAQRPDDGERDQLLGEVIGAIVVGAVRGERGQAMGMLPGSHQVVGGGL